MQDQIISKMTLLARFEAIKLTKQIEFKLK